jgi:nitroreductase
MKVVIIGLGLLCGISTMIVSCNRKNVSSKAVRQFRQANYPIDSIFLNRWSPRAMSGESISERDLMTLFEAGRWAPSSYNDQPWIFLYAPKDSAYWNLFFNLLVPFNQEWVKNAGALVAVVSRDTFESSGQFSRTHSFDAGAAWQNIALQGSFMGLVVHGMSGVDYDKAHKDLEIPDGYTLEMMFAVGKPGSLETLPVSMREFEKPSTRKDLDELVVRGTFKNYTK